MRERIGARDDIVVFGRLERDQALAHTANFDIALYPREKDEGIQAAKTAEYMGLGVPTVSYDYAVTEELRETGAGVLVEDARGFVDAVVHLVEDTLPAVSSPAAAAAAGRERELGRARETVRGRDPRSLSPVTRFHRRSQSSVSLPAPPVGWSVMRPAARNLLSNYAAYAASILAGLILTPVIIGAIGKEAFGAWAFILSLTTLLRLLDFGVTPPSIRFTALHRAGSDQTSSTALASTGLAVYLVAGRSRWSPASCSPGSSPT